LFILDDLLGELTKPRSASLNNIEEFGDKSENSSSKTTHRPHHHHHHGFLSVSPLKGIPYLFHSLLVFFIKIRFSMIRTLICSNYGDSKNESCGSLYVLNENGRILKP